jgi:predicted metalloendopeptidase
MPKTIVAGAGVFLLLTLAASAGVYPEYMDLTAKPQDDFYQYADGHWIEHHPMPPDYSVWTPFHVLRRQNADRLGQILEEAAAKGAGGTAIERQVGDFYASGMDAAAANAAGATPLQPEIERIGKIARPVDVMEEIGRLQLMGFKAGFEFGSGPDGKNSDVYLASLRQGGLGLPDRDYYLRDDEKSKAIRAAYRQHVAKILVLMGDAPGAAQAEADQVMALETLLARGSLSREVLRNPYASYHKMLVADMARYTGLIDWPGFFRVEHAPDFDSINLAQPEYFKVFAQAVMTAPIPQWQAYLKWHLGDGAAPFLSDAFIDEDFHFHGEVLAGAKQITERRQRVANEVDADLGEALGQLYVARYFPPEAKAQALRLVDDLRAALRADLQGLTWMDEATRRKAIEKLDAIQVKIGYPDRWRDYSTVQIDRGAYVLNVIRAKAFEVQRHLDRIDQPVDRAEWHMTPPTINAYYNRSGNEIVFPAGILQPPFFDPRADDASNYGAIGSFIGHELTHGFDDAGRQYDAHGNLADWWSPQSAAAFQARAAKVVAEYSGFEALPGLHLIGERTQGENIADLGGVRIAYAALQKRLGGRPQPKVDGFTPEQRFFLSFASDYAGDIRPEELRNRVLTDPHAPARFRVIGPLSNLPEFFAAFAIPEGAPMRRGESDRVTIW